MSVVMKRKTYIPGGIMVTRLGNGWAVSGSVGDFVTEGDIEVFEDEEPQASVEEFEGHPPMVDSPVHRAGGSLARMLSKVFGAYLGAPGEGLDIVFHRADDDLEGRILGARLGHPLVGEDDEGYGAAGDGVVYNEGDGVPKDGEGFPDDPGPTAVDGLPDTAHEEQFVLAAEREMGHTDGPQDAAWNVRTLALDHIRALQRRLKEQGEYVQRLEREKRAATGQVRACYLTAGGEHNGLRLGSDDVGYCEAQQKIARLYWAYLHLFQKADPKEQGVSQDIWSGKEPCGWDAAFARQGGEMKEVSPGLKIGTHPISSPFCDDGDDSAASEGNLDVLAGPNQDAVGFEIPVDETLAHEEDLDVQRTAVEKQMTTEADAVNAGALPGLAAVEEPLSPMGDRD